MVPPPSPGGIDVPNPQSGEHQVGTLPRGPLAHVYRAVDIWLFGARCYGSLVFFGDWCGRGQKVAQAGLGHGVAGPGLHLGGTFQRITREQPIAGSIKLGKPAEMREAPAQGHIGDFGAGGCG